MTNSSKNMQKSKKSLTGKELNTQLRKIFGDSLITATPSTEPQGPTSKLEIRMLGKK